MSCSVVYEGLRSDRQDLTFSEAEDILERGISEIDGTVRGGEFTNLAFMLSDQFDRGFFLGFYRDAGLSEFIGRAECSGCLPAQIGKAVSVVSEMGRTDDERTFPEGDVGDALTYAAVNRDYRSDALALVTQKGEDLSIVFGRGSNPHLAEVFRSVGLVGRDHSVRRTQRIVWSVVHASNPL